MSKEHATVAEEEYLQTIFWLEEAELPITAANVARAMQVSAPTVHEMVGRLERDGYVTRATPTSRSSSPTPGREHARGDRPPPPPDRALPHRRARHPVGRGSRGGRAAGARDVARARGAHARRDRRREDLPARPPDRGGQRIEGVPLADVEVGAKVRDPALRERGRGPAALPQGRRARARASRARVAAAGDDEVTVDLDGATATRHALASPRRCRCAPTRRRRRAPRSHPGNWCSRRSATASKPLRDVVAPGLDVLFCGINPSLLSAERGHHFAPARQPLLAGAARLGLHAAAAQPYEDMELLEYGLGVTNMVDRPTRGVADLSAAEMRAGGSRSHRSPSASPSRRRGGRPDRLATAYGPPDAGIGLQAQTVGGRPGVGAAEPVRAERPLPATGPDPPCLAISAEP